MRVEIKRRYLNDNTLSVAKTKHNKKTWSLFTKTLTRVFCDNSVTTEPILIKLSQKDKYIFFFVTYFFWRCLSLGGEQRRWFMIVLIINDGKQLLLDTCQFKSCVYEIESDIVPTCCDNNSSLMYLFNDVMLLGK